jgi:AcrR family transcriptional regulator
MASDSNSRPPSVNGYKHGRVPRDVRRSQLLELAEPLFMEKGYAGFSIDDLCRAAGVSRPIVYEHFGSKDGIYIACLRRIRDELDQALLAAAADGSDLLSTVQNAAEAWFSIVQRDPRRWSLVYGGTTGLVGPLADQLAELRDATVAQIGLVARYYAPDASDEQVAAWAHSVSGAGEQLGRWWLRNQRIPRKRVVAFYSDFLFAAANHLIATSSAAAARDGNGTGDGNGTRKTKPRRGAKKKTADPV